MTDDEKSDFSSDDDLTELLAQSFSTSSKGRDADDLPSTKLGEALSAPDDIPTAAEAEEPVDTIASQEDECGAGTTKGGKRPQLRLYDGNYDENQCAEQCALLIRRTKSGFRHGKKLKELQDDTETDEKELVEIEPAAFPSRVSAHAVTVRYYFFRGQWYVQPKRMSKYMAEILLKTLALTEKVLPVALLVPCPVLAEDEAGALCILGMGYHKHRGGIIITKDICVRSSVPLDEAVTSLRRLADDTPFASLNDAWRDLASLLTPALAMASWIKGPVPIDLSVAEEYESGKGYRQQVIAAVYAMKLHTVPTLEGGVGHRDESVATAMSKGKYCIQIDNVVGDFKSPFMAALMTAEDFSARIPYSVAVGINPRRHFFFVTSNGANLSPDIASRCNVVRLLKRPHDHPWKKFPEGDLLDHVRANQEYYLGCVFRIIKAWHDAGKQRSSNSGHRFRDWFQIIDWILEHIFGTKGVFDDHRIAQTEQVNFSAAFIKSFVDSLPENDPQRLWFAASDISAYARDNQIEVPGTEPGTEPDKVERQVGNILGRFFPSGFSEAEVVIAGCRIKRVIRYRPRTTGSGTFPAKFYFFQRISAGQSLPAATSSVRSRSDY